jgi:pimeloyl-ACP methyl ester carboxylesterase
LERIQVGPLPALATSDAMPPLLYLGVLLPPAGVDTRLVRRSAELAAEHARAIEALDAGPVDVIGVSTGGSIAQQLAADHPDLVRRLVLIATGCRLSPKTRGLQSRVAAQVVTSPS